jgi:hypothetical protein
LKSSLTRKRIDARNQTLLGDNMYRVSVHGNRPDFRVFIDLLYRTGRNVDTDGDSNPVNSRTWTYLYIADRESDDPFIEIHAKQVDPDIFEVESKSHELETLAALYLFLYCGTSIAFGDSELDQKAIENLKRLYAAQLRSAVNAVWHQSSDQNPYPNIS